jgi:hypothetical protein
MRVELLYSDADPTYMETRQRLVEVLTEDAFETPIQMIAVRSAEDAELLGFRGSPTIRIDGVDIDPLAADAPVGLGLRRYDGDEQREPSSGLPSRRLIRAAIDRARGWSHGAR